MYRGVEDASLIGQRHALPGLLDSRHKVRVWLTELRQTGGQTDMDHAAPQDAHQSKVRDFVSVRSSRAPWRAQTDSHVICPPASSQQMILGYKYLLIGSTFITTVMITEAAHEYVTVGCNQVLLSGSRIRLYSSKHLWGTFTFTPL